MPPPHGLAVTGKQWSRRSVTRGAESKHNKVCRDFSKKSERKKRCLLYTISGWIFSGFERKLSVKFAYYWIGLPWWLSGKGSACNTGDTEDAGSIPGSGRSPGGGHGNLLEYSCLENSMDRVAWWATVHEDTKSQTQLSNWACTHHWIRWPGNLHKKETEE